MDDGVKLLGDIETGIRDRLMAMTFELEGEFAVLKSAFLDMPDEIKALPMYKTLGERIASVEALLNTLESTAGSFPMPIDPPVSHGSL